VAQGRQADPTRGRQAGRQAGRQKQEAGRNPDPGRWAAGRQAGRQAGTQAGRQKRRAGRRCPDPGAVAGRQQNCSGRQVVVKPRQKSMMAGRAGRQAPGGRQVCRQAGSRWQAVAGTLPGGSRRQVQAGRQAGGRRSRQGGRCGWQNRTQKTQWQAVAGPRQAVAVAGRQAGRQAGRGRQVRQAGRQDPVASR